MKFDHGSMCLDWSSWSTLIAVQESFSLSYFPPLFGQKHKHVGVFVHVDEGRMDYCVVSWHYY